MPRLTEAAVARCFDPSTLSRARDYVRAARVLEVESVAEGAVSGRVIGHQASPYQQSVVIETDETGRVDVRGECTCPMEVNCKHVAAVALVLAAEGYEFVAAEAPSPLDAKIAPDPAVESWLGNVRNELSPRTDYPPETPNRLLYVIRKKANFSSPSIVVELLSARLLKEGGYGKTNRFNISNIHTGAFPKYVLPIDARLARSLYRSLTQLHYPDAVFRLDGEDGARLLEAMLDTGRCVWEDVNGTPLRKGAARQATLSWIEHRDGSQQLDLDVQGIEAIPTTPPWYVDLEAGECGPLDANLSGELVKALLSAPVVKPEYIERVRGELQRLIPGRPDLWPEVKREPVVRSVSPIPCLTVTREACQYQEYSYSWRKPAATTERVLPIARLEFDYGGVRVRGAGSEVRKIEDDQVLIMPRRLREESRYPAFLLNAGWDLAQTAYSWKLPKGHGEDYVILPKSATGLSQVNQTLYEFVRRTVPELRLNGWDIRIEGNLDVVAPDESDWRLETREKGKDWFDLGLGVMVEGERIDLRPILVKAYQSLTHSGFRQLESVSDEEEVYHELPNGRVLALPARRIKPLLQALIELFGNVGEWDQDLSLSAARAAEVELLSQTGLPWQEPERLKELKGRLSSFEGIRPVAVPSGLNGELRHYQKEGLDWLQFLRELGFGGVLADDMGLGKTVQTLAHILVEKEAGRLDRPVLIVAPTSTLPNWRHEVRRFAPSLRLLTLHGTDRKRHFAEMPTSDVVLTSYPLLARDIDSLSPQPFHMVVLDEAQNIKNPSTSMAQAACKLEAPHRICLSGTPVENNLEELWSLYQFLMPGLLGNLTSFRRNFRTPIESRDEARPRERLARRIRPFVLRRTKEQVTPELPPKTEVVERVGLSGSQRDLYESLRLAMDKRVRDLIANKGIEKSRIEILDALLKLRQVCCDPRLVKLESARKAQGSAKLERLMEMLGELRDEGRRVLLFSQFTSMLDLIEESLRQSGYEWVRISGDTKDRETPVRRFQNQEVPLFLISLKAGGTGLNLTAADTVIHYDPWWNPAVEEQATDRAHRIGQDKPVFVFKLVAEGTVEERILDLQKRKADLAGLVFAGDTDASAWLTADDLRWVFESETDENTA